MLSEILVFNLYIQPKSVPERALNERGGSSSTFDDRVHSRATCVLYKCCAIPPTSKVACVLKPTWTRSSDSRLKMDWRVPNKTGFIG